MLGVRRTMLSLPTLPKRDLCEMDGIGWNRMESDVLNAVFGSGLPRLAKLSRCQDQCFGREND